MAPSSVLRSIAAAVALGVPCACAAATSRAVEPSPTPAAGEPGAALRFGKRAPAVGTRIEDTSDMSVRISMTVSAAGQVVAEPRGTQRKTERRRIEVLQATQTEVTAIRVEYLERAEHEEGDDGRATRPSVLQGRTYVVARRGDALVATDGEGAAVAGQELDELLHEHGNLGKPSRFAAFIPDRPVAVGERLEPSPDVAAEMFGDGGRDVAVRSAAFVLEGAPSPGLAAFAVDVTVTLGGEPPMDLHLRGRVVVRVEDSAPVAMNLAGPLSIDGASAETGAVFRGSGQMTLARTAEYR